MADTPITFTVTAERGPYQVMIGAGLTRRLGRLQPLTGTAGRPLVVSCRPVWRHHGSRLRHAGTLGPAVLIGDGERAKTLRSVQTIYAACADRRLDRGSTILAVGGGVVGDVAGFAAATYLRGIRLVQIPTTLLAQVDSAIGGKVGVNLPAGKNLVGAFHAPDLVVCDPELLATLPPREFRAGLYEVIKYGVIASADLFDRVARSTGVLLERRLEALTPVIAECCRIKAAVVERDEREAGPRRALNFGHTIGHALEAVTGYRRFRHGEAVGWGMRAAARLSVARGLMRDSDLARLDAVIAALGPLPRIDDLSVPAIIAATRLDKKVVGGRLHFVLADGIGQTTVVTDVTEEEILLALTRTTGTTGTTGTR